MHVPDEWKQAVNCYHCAQEGLHWYTYQLPSHLSHLQLRPLQAAGKDRCQVDLHLSYDNYNILCDDRSTCTNLLECLNDVTCNIQGKCQTAMI